MKVHLSAVCGTAMASLAGLLLEKGHEVSGSDQDVYPPMSTQLAELGIEVRSPYAASNVPKDAELVVIGNALSRGNPEVEEVLDRRQRYTSQAALLAEEFIRGRTSIVVAGTHGKTTTTSLVAHLLAASGRDPSFLIGGVPLDFDRSYRLGQGEHFVVEGDEYDSSFFDKRPKFLHYLPDVAVIGNVEFDHADIYADLPQIVTAFERFVGVVPRRGVIIAGVESKPVAGIVAKALSRVETFGVEVDAIWRAEEVEVDGEGSRFRLVHDGKDLGVFRTALAGVHNVRNALAALATVGAVGVRPAEARGPLAGFQGVRRRLELRGEVGGVRVFDDFAHHPTAVRETLVALRAREGLDRANGKGRLWAVFEPRSYTARTNRFEQAFAEAFAVADRVIVAAAHLRTKVPEGQRLSEEALVASVIALGGEAECVREVSDIVGRIVSEARPGDSVAILSNGGFGGIHARLLAALPPNRAT